MGGEVMPLREAFERAEPLISRALELDKDSSEAHLANGNLALQYRFDWQLAVSEFGKAIELNPNNAAAYAWRSILQCLIGDIENALEDANRARELDPLSTMTLHSASRCLIAKRSYGEAIAMWQRVAQLEPNEAHVHVHLAELHCHTGDHATAEKEADVARRLETDSEERIMLVPIYSRLGKQEEARALLQSVQEGRQEGYTSPTRLAAALLATGQEEKALGILEECFSKDRTSFLFSYQDPFFDSLRGNPRFAALVEGLKLPRSDLST
jgi:tetratricopeptide (TPR) repeat protein